MSANYAGIPTDISFSFVQICTQVSNLVFIFTGVESIVRAVFI
jgi:hypothetical protein